MKESNLPDLSRTKAAIAKFDTADKKFLAMDLMSMSKPQTLDELDELEKAIGIAYGLDTADRNQPKDCHGIHTYPVGREFVRRMVKKWEESLDNSKN